jgi:hypothetical protein
MFKLRLKYSDTTPSLQESRLFDEKTFYPAFMADLRGCHEQVVIECPFITSRRINTLLPTFQKLKQQGVSITINTRDPLEHEESLRIQAQDAIASLQRMGVQVLYTGGHHRKLAILDKRVLWEGSLNILSQSASCEIMRRMDSKEMAEKMIVFTKLHNFIQ